MSWAFNALSKSLKTLVISIKKAIVGPLRSWSWKFGVFACFNNKVRFAHSQRSFFFFLFQSFLLNLFFLLLCLLNLLKNQTLSFFIHLGFSFVQSALNAEKHWPHLSQPMRINSRNAVHILSWSHNQLMINNVLGNIAKAK